MQPVAVRVLDLDGPQLDVGWLGKTLALILAFRFAASRRAVTSLW